MFKAIGSFIKMFFGALTKGMSMVYQYACAGEDTGIWVRTHSAMAVAKLQLEMQAEADAVSKALGITPKQLFLDIPHRAEAES